MTNFIFLIDNFFSYKYPPRFLCFPQYDSAMPCKCGSTNHTRTSSKKCSLYKPRKPPPTDNVYKTSESVYKTGLGTFCRPRFKKSILEIVHIAVRNITQIAFQGSSFLYTYVLHELEHGRNVDKLFDRTFLRPFFTIMAENTFKNAPQNVLDFYNHRYQPYMRNFENFPKSVKLGQCITYLVKEYLTNLEIHISSHFEKIFIFELNREFRNRWGMKKYEAQNLINNIMTDNENERKIFLLENDHLKDKVDRYVFLKASLHNQLKYIYEYNFINLGRMDDKKLKIHQIIPLYTWNAKYITIDTDALSEMFLHLIEKGKGKMKGEERKRLYESNPSKFWTLFFKIPKRHLKKAVDEKLFSFMIKTDGVGVSVHLYKWKTMDSEMRNCTSDEERKKLYAKRKLEERERDMEFLKSLDKDPNSRSAGVDPGLDDLMTVYNEIYDDPNPELIRKKKRHSYPGKIRWFSNKRYYTESMFKYTTERARMFLSRANLLIWSTKIPSIGTTFASFTNYLEYILDGEFLTVMLNVKCSKSYVKLRWKRYIHNKQTVYNFCKEVLAGYDPKLTIIYYGDASFQHNMKGKSTSPKQMRFVKELRRMNANVWMTSEFNSSLVCSSCKSEKRMKGFESSKNRYKVRECQTTTCCKIWNRDGNAARNILDIGRTLIRTGEKPLVFSKILPKDEK